VDHIIVLGEMHLRRVLKSYADYYNSVEEFVMRTSPPIAPDVPERDTYIVLAQQATSLDPLVCLRQQCRWNHEP
jgi:hypothetical protein